jgi:hypothetical protein
MGNIRVEREKNLKIDENGAREKSNVDQRSHPLTVSCLNSVFAASDQLLKNGVARPLARACLG